MSHETEIGGAASGFPQTRWTLIQSSREGTQARKAALDELLISYWKPLYFYLRRKGLNVEEAKDAVQGFFTHMIEQNFLARPDPNKGRFRSYLRVAVNNYLAGLHEHQSAQKRGGGVHTISLDFDLAERDFTHAPGGEGGSDAPDAAYDREWALGVMERALFKLENEFRTGIRRGPFDIFHQFFKTGVTPSYEETARKHRMSLPQFKSFLHRTRERFRELVRAEVAQTLSNAGDADAEIADLFRALRA